jgi:hypothetical protein
MTFKFIKPRERRTWFVDLSEWSYFEEAIKRLEGMIKPDETPSIGLQSSVNGNIVQRISPASTTGDYTPGNMVPMNGPPELQYRSGPGNMVLMSGSAPNPRHEPGGGPMPPAPPLVNIQDAYYNQ